VRPRGGVQKSEPFQDRHGHHLLSGAVGQIETQIGLQGGHRGRVPRDGGGRGVLVVRAVEPARKHWVLQEQKPTVRGVVASEGGVVRGGEQENV
tara:strand:+ start:56 stop:337 length:282 start_codon:yes stop_codon:yes gene_type:complete